MNIIVKPLITEKAMIDAANGFYTFMVNPDANKPQVAEAINLAYGVKVVSVRTVKISGETRRAGRRRGTIVVPDGKKAIVKLQKGQKIDAFDVTERPVEK